MASTSLIGFFVGHQTSPCYYYESYESQDNIIMQYLLIILCFHFINII